MEFQQTAESVFMVRPQSFGSNPQTLDDNHYQQPQADDDDVAIQQQAVEEFDQAVAALREHGITVMVCQDTPDAQRYDAVFPNNWISTHHDGTVFLYPMKSPFRRKERELPLLDQLKTKFRLGRIVDLSHHENVGHYLEGTGSLVFDHRARVAYAALSDRTDLSIAKLVGEALGYEVFAFETVHRDYHTNVIMAIGHSAALLGANALKDSDVRRQIKGRLEASGHRVVELTENQVGAFAGNALNLGTGGRHWVCSSSAWASLDHVQRLTLESTGDAIVLDVSTIQRYGGGSIRCMIGEIFLSPAAAD